MKFTNWFNFNEFFKKWPRKQNNISNKSETMESFTDLLGPWEASVVSLQSILIWENPRKSLSAVLFMNIAYWLLVYSNVKFYFVTSLFGLLAFVYHQWIYSIWPEISTKNSSAHQEEWTPVNPSVLSGPEVSQYLQNSLKYINDKFLQLLQLRHTQHYLFCALLSSLFLLFGFIGRCASGVTLMYIILMGVMLIPGFIKYFVPETVLEDAKKIFSYVLLQESSEETSEDYLLDFLPTDLPAIKQVSGGAKMKKLHSKTAKIKATDSEDSSSFTHGLTPRDFPSLENSSELGENDLLPTQDLPSFDAEYTNITSDFFPDEEIRFAPEHFSDNDISDYIGNVTDSAEQIKINRPDSTVWNFSYSAENATNFDLGERNFAEKVRDSDDYGTTFAKILELSHSLQLDKIGYDEVARDQLFSTSDDKNVFKSTEVELNDDFKPGFSTTSDTTTVFAEQKFAKTESNLLQYQKSQSNVGPSNKSNVDLLQSDAGSSKDLQVLSLQNYVDLSNASSVALPPFSLSNDSNIAFQSDVDSPNDSNVAYQSNVDPSNDSNVAFQSEVGPFNVLNAALENTTNLMSNLSQQVVAALSQAVSDEIRPSWTAKPIDASYSRDDEFEMISDDEI